MPNKITTINTSSPFIAAHRMHAPSPAYVQ